MRRRFSLDGDRFEDVPASDHPIKGFPASGPAYFGSALEVGTSVHGYPAMDSEGSVTIFRSAIQRVIWIAEDSVNRCEITETEVEENK